MTVLEEGAFSYERGTPVAPGGCREKRDGRSPGSPAGYCARRTGLTRKYGRVGPHGSQWRAGVQRLHLCFGGRPEQENCPVSLRWDDGKRDESEAHRAVAEAALGEVGRALHEQHHWPRRHHLPSQEQSLLRQNLL